MKIHKNDNVIILKGKDRGKQGKVTVAIPADNKVIIEGMNIAKKRIKSRVTGKKGQMIERSMPMHVSNVALIDPKTKKPTRVSFKIVKDKKVRVAQKSGEVL
ncbi:MAG: 50S ribosomal protein L24 [Candidatus Pacebacteria bacterium]|nr:50S ribosomal protein L24 [Candidatus Paceibacterota bacterium]